MIKKQKKKLKLSLKVPFKMKSWTTLIITFKKCMFWLTLLFSFHMPQGEFFNVHVCMKINLFGSYAKLKWLSFTFKILVNI
jgi:hypothetical protein